MFLVRDEITQKAFNGEESYTYYFFPYDEGMIVTFNHFDVRGGFSFDRDWTKGRRRYFRYRGRIEFQSQMKLLICKMLTETREK